LEEKTLQADKPVLIMGVGNLLLKDEGVGVHVAQRLMEMELPPGVEVLDGGTGGYDLLDDIEGRDKVVIVDTVKGGHRAGSIYRITADDIEDSSEPSHSLHDVGVSHLLKLADMLGVERPEIVVIGVEPKDMETYAMELSPEVEAQIPKVIELVMKEIDH
jgi:hydrogenase maturation protease